MLPTAVIARIAENDPKYNRVNLSNNSLFTTQADEYTQQLIDVLNSNQHVTSLDLSGVGVSNIGAEAFAKFLLTNETLLKLDLSNNKIDSNGIQSICAALKENKGLEELRLLGNCVPGEGCLTTLVESLEYNTSLLNIVWRLESRQSFKVNQCITRNKEIQRRKKIGKSVDDIDPNIRRETERKYLESKANGTTAPVEVEAEITEAPPATGGPYSLKVLQSKFIPSDVDTNVKEDYLSEEEFKTVFKVSREDFAKFPAWKKKQAKKDANLF